MTTLISFLRGINVGGSNKILMNDLKDLYVKLGFRGIINYIQSGNVIFQSEEGISAKEVALKIETALEKRFELRISVIVRTLEEMKQIIINNPFKENKHLDEEKFHVTMFDESPLPESISSIEKLDFSPDMFVIIDKNIYLFCPNGYGISKLSNTFFEKRLRVKATTRNWRTITKMVEISKENLSPDLNYGVTHPKS